MSDSVVRWKGEARPTTFVSSTSLQAAISAADIAAAGTAQVTVFTPGPGGGTSAPVNFTVNQAPTLTISAELGFTRRLRDRYAQRWAGWRQRLAGVGVNDRAQHQQRAVGLRRDRRDDEDVDGEHAVDSGHLTNSGCS